MVAHVLGAAESASLRELAHQYRAGAKLARSRKGVLIDAVNEVQVRERADLAPAELLERLAAAQPRFRRTRRRLPAPLRAVRVPTDEHHDKVSLGHLMDVIYTRDTWMHRVDICRATGRTMVLTPDHDGRIVADVVAEWAALHGQPVELVLAGPAGGTFTHGTGGDRIEMDAVDFCNVMAGRGPGTGLLETGVLF
jgi:uncharacterized protein (TIGR03083 family)